MRRLFGRRYLARSLAVTVAFLVAGCITALDARGIVAGEPGDLDPSFSGDGIRFVDFGGNEEASAVALGESGVVVAGRSSGRVALTRLTDAGALDRDYGDRGRTTLDPTTRQDREVAWARDGDDSMVVLGEASDDGSYFLSRIGPEGDADRSFGTGGVVEGRFTGSFVQLRDVLVQSSGRILILATIDGASTVRAYRRDGTRALGWGREGAVRFRAFDAALLLEDSSGRVLVIGSARGELIVRALAGSGERDSSFGVEGRAEVEVGGDLLLQGATLTRSDDIVIAGSRFTGSESNVMVARLTSCGVADPEFGAGDGVSTVDIGPVDDAWDVEETARGRMIVVGSVANDLFGDDQSQDLFALGLTNRGSTWRRFGEGGVVRTDFGFTDEVVLGLDSAVSRGRLTVVGRARNDMLVARFLLGDR